MRSWAGPSYIVHPSDTAPALVAFDARIKIAGPDGRENDAVGKILRLARVDSRHENILKPGEIVTEIFVPEPKSGSKGFYHKVRERLAWDHAIVSIATVVESSGGDRARRARCVGRRGTDPLARGQGGSISARQKNR